MLSVETDEHTHVTGTTYTATKNYSIHTLLQFILGNLADNGIIKQHVIQTTFYVTFFCCIFDVTCKTCFGNTMIRLFRLFTELIF